MKLELPIGLFTPEQIAYLERQLRYIVSAVNSRLGVVIVQQKPDKPREGTIYYLTKDIDDIIVEGYYVWVNDQWRKLAYE